MSTDSTPEPLCLPLPSPSEADIPAGSEDVFPYLTAGLQPWYTQFIQLYAYGPSGSGLPTYLDSSPIIPIIPYAPELFSAGDVREHPYPFASHTATAMDESDIAQHIDTSVGHLPHLGLPAAPSGAHATCDSLVSFVAPAALTGSWRPPTTHEVGPQLAALAPSISTPCAASPTSDASSATASSHKPRNAQVSMEEWLAAKPTFKRCQQCPWCDVRRASGQTDWYRHLETHCWAAKSDPTGRQCVGVPLYEALDYGIAPDIPGMNMGGVWMVGGCGTIFSRRDALLRHLQNSRSCVGHNHKMSDKAPSSPKRRKNTKSRTPSKLSKRRA